MTTTPVQPGAPIVTSKKRYSSPLLWIGLLALVIAIAAMLFFILRPNPAQQNQQAGAAMISGTFNINGVIPPDASVLIEKRDLDEKNKTTAAQNIQAVDGGTWSFQGVTAGETYELTASVIVNQNVVATADPITITAPASEEVFTFNLTVPNPTEPATISGIVQVNGYMPPGATISVNGRELGADSFTTVVPPMQATNRGFISYSSALAGQTYELVGILSDASGNQIGSSDPLTITAPAANETLTINSQAIPPATPTPTATLTPTPTPTVGPSATAGPTATPTAPAPTFTPTPVPTPISISGSINFNGVAPLNSRITIFQKVYNSQNYTLAVDNISPVNGSTWTWNGATAGTWYNVIAILKQAQPNGTDQDIADSQVVSVAAPASSLVMNINSGTVLAAPSGNISVSCGTQSGNTWNAQITYTPQGGAQSYWLQIGSSNGGSDIYNSMQNAQNGNGNQTVTAGFNNNQTYYARYAYANVQNAGQPQYSPFSGTTSLMCN